MHGSARQCLAQLARQDAKFDLILLDPPYRDDVVEETIALIVQGSLLSKSGWLIVETSATTEVGEAWSHYSLNKEKLAGDTKISFLINE